MAAAAPLASYAPRAPDPSKLRAGEAWVSAAVQGVGFRPWVHRLAADIGLAGSVHNAAHGVRVVVEGEADCVERLRAALALGPGAPARVEAVRWSPLAVSGRRGFAIGPSAERASAGAPLADLAICDACLDELFDPTDRRYRHAFVNCTRCGPRYTVIRALPYDRPRTTMAPFDQCGACAAEYADPRDRRFHAQPNACPDCGPRLAMTDADGRALDVADPIAGAARRLAAGQILALKGVGGYQLVCDARDPRAVAALRARKGREARPFALMVPGPASAARLVALEAPALAALVGTARPVVIAPRRPGLAPPLAPPLAGIAPGLDRLGVMLPASALHYLLLHELAGRPHARRWFEAARPEILVVTSGNRSGEPIARDEDEALARLTGVADAFLVHDRAIATRCDDSVLLSHPGSVVMVRRARGHAPHAVELASGGPATVATGASMKVAPCLTRGARAYLGQHVGDLGDAGACRVLAETITHLESVLGVTPERFAHDLHPDLPSTRLAMRLAAERGLPCIGVQHHHAHAAAVAAEHGLAVPFLALVLDGHGHGADGAAWGGELLRVEGHRCTRLGHLRELAQPGGEQAVREPWRMAASALHALGRVDEIGTRIGAPAAGAIAAMLERGVRCPPSSSAGRWFDAAAALLGLRASASYEAQCAMELEALARAHGPVEPMSGGWRVSADGVLDPLALLGAVADLRADPPRGAALFHETLAHGLAAWAAAAARGADLGRIVLAGGCMLNTLLRTRLLARLAGAGLEVLEPREAPPGDGAIALGQAWVALHVPDPERGAEYDAASAATGAGAG